MNIPNKGFAPIIILIVALLAAGLGGYVYFQSKDEPITSTTTKTIPDSAITTTTTTLVTITDWTCGNSVTFTYKGEVVTYGTVESQDRCWLDRNLGASQVASALNHSESYGDLFQWGRLDDGHQDRKSKNIMMAFSNSDNPGHSNFIGVMDGDWRSPKNNNLWQGVSGINNPCLSGWRLPTSDEWDIERLSWSSNNAEGAFGSPLKLTAAGVRYTGDQPLINASFNGSYWSSTIGSHSIFALNLHFRDYSVLPSELIEANKLQAFIIDNASIVDAYRADGASVRCLKD